MSQWAEIRHMCFVEGVARREAARRLDVDRKTVSRALAQATAPRDGRPRVAPGGSTRAGARSRRGFVRSALRAPAQVYGSQRARRDLRPRRRRSPRGWARGR